MANTHSIGLTRSSNQFLSITDASQTGLEPSGDFSIEAWVNIATAPTSGQEFGIVGKWGGASNRSYFFMYANESGTLRLRFYVSSTSLNTAAIDVDLGTATWKHLAVTYDSTTATNNVRIYIDGTLTGGAQSMSTGAMDGSAVDFEIGRYNDGGSGAALDGKMDDVRFWSDIRTASEITNNKDSELVGTEANLVSYWKLNNSLLDETSNSNDLTNNNSAVFSTDVPFSGTTFIPKVMVY